MTEPAVEEFVSGSNLFTSDVYLYLIRNNNDNIIVSPFSAEVILGLAETGAKNNTSQEILSALRSSFKSKDAETAFKVFLTILTTSEACQMFLFSKIYLSKLKNPRSDFQVTARKIFHSDVVVVDFENPEQVTLAINDSLRKESHDRFDNVIEVSAVTPETQMVWVSAISLRGNWLKPFRKGIPNQNFFLTKKQIVKVEMMENVGHFNYYESEGLEAKLVELRLVDETVAMVVVLPFEREGLPHVESHIDEVFSTDSFTLEHVKIIMPKFQIEAHIDFQSIMESLGMREAFTDRADFTGIDDKKPNIFIDKFIQKVYVTVWENGLDVGTLDDNLNSRNFEASVKTKLFQVDHPFLFFIKIKDLVIISGRVIFPSM